MKLIIGLGNPGKEYQNTKHNAGFMCLDYLCSKLNITLDKKKFNAEYYHGFINGEKVLIIKPLTYMNLSGESLIQFVSYFNVEHKDILVLYDDMDTEIGSIRIRTKGSSGRQNGLKNIINHLKSSDVARIRIGIGRNPKYNTVDYVLSKFSTEEQERLKEALEQASDAAIYFINNDIDKVMNIFNKKNR